MLSHSFSPLVVIYHSTKTAIYSREALAVFVWILDCNAKPMIYMVLMIMGILVLRARV